MYNLVDKWVGVRPVRFREDIYGLVELAVEKKEGVTTEEMRVRAIEIRTARENRRIKSMQKSVALTNKNRKKELLLTKVEQIIRVLRKTGLIEKKNKQFLGTQDAETLISIKQKDEIAADAFFIERLLNSDFKTYWLFLKALNGKKIEIPASKTVRNSDFSDFIRSQGFLLDAWSFYVIRDLFYDFSLVNYVIDSKKQRVFPLYAISDEDLSKSYKYVIQGPDNQVYFWPIDDSRFIENLVSIYLEYSNNKWNRMADLIKLRENYSMKYCIPERQFDILFKIYSVKKRDIISSFRLAAWI